MKSKYETLCSVVEYVKNESYNPIAELLMMGFTPAQLVNEFGFEKEKVRECPLFPKMEQTSKERLDETKWPSLFERYSVFDAALISRYQLSKEQIDMIKNTKIYNEMKETYSQDKKVALEDVMEHVFDTYDERFLSALTNGEKRYLAVYFGDKGEDYHPRSVFVFVDGFGDGFLETKRALESRLIKGLEDVDNIEFIEEIDEKEFLLRTAQMDVLETAAFTDKRSVRIYMSKEQNKAEERNFTAGADNKIKEPEHMDKEIFLKRCLNEKVKLPMDGIKAWEFAIQQVLETLFPDKEWYELTSVSIFMELLSGKLPIEVCEMVWLDVAGNLSFTKGLKKAESLDEQICKAMPAKKVPDHKEFHLKKTADRGSDCER